MHKLVVLQPSLNQQSGTQYCTKKHILFLSFVKPAPNRNNCLSRVRQIVKQIVRPSAESRCLTERVPMTSPVPSENTNAAGRSVLTARRPLRPAIGSETAPVTGLTAR